MPSTLKRGQGVLLPRMRKNFALKPVALGVAAICLSGCGEEQQAATIYTNADECTAANPQLAEQCQAAYQQALAEAARTGPKYNTQQDCEVDFGSSQCHNVRNESGSFFMPFMAGYMLSNLLSPSGYQSQPMYTSYSPYSSYRYRWVGTDGYDFGDSRRRSVNVDKDVFKPKPTVAKTISRGGFGSTVRAKSSWGSSSKSSWGS